MNIKRCLPGFFRIADYCTACTDKLHRRDQFAQMHNLMEVRDKEFGKLVEMVGALHQCYWPIAENFEFSGTLLLSVPACFK